MRVIFSDEGLKKRGSRTITVRKHYENEFRVHSHGKDLADQFQLIGEPLDMILQKVN
jgi:hypothetical protein